MDPRSPQQEDMEINQFNYKKKGKGKGRRRQPMTVQEMLKVQRAKRLS